ncbi:hypothetical protein [Pseudonocardia abyssalis]|uniref:hypothetical protein n=1 Tax=Pseudonocardia abyssalis TaxID=2792008 RepID=UPI001CECD3A9|nr:hypothetical protein [Pseudonocardia abyssalis]
MTSGTDHGPTDPIAPGTPSTAREQRRALKQEQRSRFGGTKWGSAFFGWLTALGTAVLLSGIAASITQGYGLTTVPGGPPAGVVAGIVAAVVLFVAYFCGGYVAGRMARFDGARQGVAVWLWAVLVAVAVAVLVAVSGTPVDLTPLAALVGGVLDPAALTIGGLILLSAVLLVGLVGAVLGGLAGMRFHRRVDRATAPVTPVTPTV